MSSSPAPRANHSAASGSGAAQSAAERDTAGFLRRTEEARAPGAGVRSERDGEGEGEVREMGMGEMAARPGARGQRVHLPARLRGRMPPTRCRHGRHARTTFG